MSDLLDFSIPGKPKLVSDYAAWKLSTGVLVVSPEDAWNYQAKKLAEVEGQLIIAADVMKKSKKVIEDLKAWVEKDLQIINDMEIELDTLRNNANGQETFS